MRKSVWLLIAALALIAMPASADVVIHLVNGQAMPATSVRWVDDMVHVYFGDDGSIAFPRAAIERVEESGRSLALGRNAALAGRRTGPGAMIAGSTEKAEEARIDPTKKVRPVSSNPGVPAPDRLNSNGTSALRGSMPAYGNRNAVARDQSTMLNPHAARNANVVGGQYIRGAALSNGQYVLASDQVPNRPRAVNITMRGVGAPQTPRPPDGPKGIE